MTLVGRIVGIITAILGARHTCQTSKRRYDGSEPGFATVTARLGIRSELREGVFRFLDFAHEQIGLAKLGQNQIRVSVFLLRQESFPRILKLSERNFVLSFPLVKVPERIVRGPDAILVASLCEKLERFFQRTERRVDFEAGELRLALFERGSC